jgi:hypothetical protein
MDGSGDKSVIVCGPEAMLKLIVLLSKELLAEIMACRNEPAPESLVLVTTN